MYQTRLLPDKYDKVRKTIQPVIYRILSEITGKCGIETLQYIYELDCMGKLVNQDLIKFLRSEYDIDQLKYYISEYLDSTETMLQVVSDRIICDIIRLNGLDEFERLGHMNKIQTLTNRELITFLREEIHETCESNDSSDDSD